MIELAKLLDIKKDGDPGSNENPEKDVMEKKTLTTEDSLSEK